MSTDTQAKHTPAPWIWRNLHDINAQIPDGKMKVIQGDNGQGFAYTCGLSAEVDTANARLIAAAPDLLEALIRTRNLLAQSGFEKGVYNSAIDQADVAIAKAEGRR